MPGQGTDDWFCGPRRANEGCGAGAASGLGEAIHQGLSMEAKFSKEMLAGATPWDAHNLTTNLSAL